MEVERAGRREGEAGREGGRTQGVTIECPSTNTYPRGARTSLLHGEFRVGGNEDTLKRDIVPPTRPRPRGFGIRRVKVSGFEIRVHAGLGRITKLIRRLFEFH